MKTASVESGSVLRRSAGCEEGSKRPGKRQERFSLGRRVQSARAGSDVQSGEPQRKLPQN